jgi:hypothetical protein
MNLERISINGNDSDFGIASLCISLDILTPANKEEFMAQIEREFDYWCKQKEDGKI